MRAQEYVVNGLKDLKLRRELMAKHDYRWDILCCIVANRGTAAESDEKLGRLAPQVAKPYAPIKQEVAEFRFENYCRNDSRNNNDTFYKNSDLEVIVGLEIIIVATVVISMAEDLTVGIEVVMMVINVTVAKCDIIAEICITAVVMTATHYRPRSLKPYIQ